MLSARRISNPCPPATRQYFAVFITSREYPSDPCEGLFIWKSDAFANLSTTYFRTEFSADGAPGDLTLTMRVDDGAVAYLNGVEVARFNVPAGPVSFETRAVSAIWGAAEVEDRVFAVDPNLVRVGENVLAVSVHQNGRRSSDLSFLASLVGNP